MIGTAGDEKADALDQTRWVPAHTAIVSTLLPIFFFNTYCTELFAMTAPAIATEWGVAPKLLAGAMSLGWLFSGVGSLLGGICGDQFGRYRSVLLASALTGLASLATVFATGPLSLSLLRSLVGLALGATIPPALSLIAECTPKHRRGIVISLAMIASPLGLSACALISGAMLPHYGWKLVFLVGGSLTVAATAVFMLVAMESPRFLAQRPARRAEYLQVLDRLGIDVPVEPVVAQAAASSSMAQVLSRDCLGITLRTWACFMAVFMSITAFTSWVPTALSGAGFPATLAGAAMSAWSLGGVVGTLVTGFVMTRWGPARSAQSFAVGSALAMGLAVLARSEPGGDTTGLLAAMALAGFMMSSLITTVFAFATDAYPSAVRSTGVGMGAMVGRCSAVLGSFGGVYLIDGIGLKGYFLLIGLLCATPLPVLWSSRVNKPA